MTVQGHLAWRAVASGRRRAVSSRLSGRGCSLLVAVALSLVATVRAGAGDCCCAHCGCDQPCRKVCRLVCEEKKVEIICWGCKCEDFCLPGPSEPGCKHCETVCSTCDESCDCTKPYAEPKRFVWFDWAPGCAKIHTKTKLMQKKVTKTVPSYKWVVEDLCAGCEANCNCAAAVAVAEIPQPSAVDAKLKIPRENSVDPVIR